MEELKPCPFCGGINLIIGEQHEIDMTDEMDDSGYHAVCCNAISGGCGAVSGYGKNRQVAIQKWNERKE